MSRFLGYFRLLTPIFLQKILQDTPPCMNYCLQPHTATQDHWQTSFVFINLLLQFFSTFHFPVDREYIALRCPELISSLSIHKSFKLLQMCNDLFFRRVDSVWAAVCSGGGSWELTINQTLRVANTP